MKTKMLLGGALLLLLVGPAHADNGTKAALSGIDVQAMDRSVRPQDDFYQYVNGGWIRSTEMPGDKSRLSMFSVLDDQAQEQLKAIIAEAAQNSGAKTGSNPQKLGDMYNSFFDQKAVEALGIAPLKPQLEAIARLSTHDSVATELARLSEQGVSGPVGFYVYPDAKDPSVYGLWLTQSGLTMPDRDYYLKDDEKSVKLRQSFQDYAAALLKAAGYPDAEGAAKRVLDLETRLADNFVTRVESRDAEKNYNKRSGAQVASLLEGFPWKAYSEASGLRDGAMIVRTYPYFEKLGSLFASTDVQSWKDYLAFHTVDEYASALSSEFENLHFGFHQTALNGVPEKLPRWKLAVGATSSVLGEVLGQEYVARHFSPQAKARMEVLVANLLKAYGQSIKEIDWMSEETKLKALDKLAQFKPKIGYPDTWRDYSGLTIKADDLVGNLRRSAKFEQDFDLARVGKPVDPVDWGMTPQTVNAYYSPTRNEIVFPAAILQPPFFNLEADDAVNYGGIGAVIGHEIGHGFDDQGSKYDGTGNLRSWWTDQDRAAFDALGDKLVGQYDKFSPLEGLFVNGRLTLGENIGDLAGVAIAYKAYTDSLDGKEPPVIDGFTGPQRFFMGWAQVWRGKIREDALRQRLLTDSHSPAQYRVNGPLRNMDAFYEAFGVQSGDPMYLPSDDRVVIW
jgi:endothelin-converting enzyme/putative endopeptidase